VEEAKEAPLIPIFRTFKKQIIEILLQNDFTLSEIAREIGISKPTTSMYLKRLEESGIVKGTYEKNYIGRAIRYRLQPFHIIFSINPDAKITINFIAEKYGKMRLKITLSMRGAELHQIDL
jgi:predicted transcriptional regulator